MQFQFQHVRNFDATDSAIKNFSKKINIFPKSFWKFVKSFLYSCDQVKT